ncbi:hypothetical protein [Gimesia algae]|uniref:Uncharacterized protein n=1 Tax=Gimesia algae TaxID=2527971 RepID=A0A517VF38_9PLAN|nr:hypothetical protein [Gimesia algae]QDT91623.1 hypothetical protein Pan161_32850 [Gimesia algae]
MYLALKAPGPVNEGNEFEKPGTVPTPVERFVVKCQCQQAVK